MGRPTRRIAGHESCGPTGLAIRIRPAKERSHADHGWLDTWHTFSFGDYDDPRFMGFRHLRVINQDFVAPRRGFATHGHRDMEIITDVLEGALQHRDSLGTGSIIRPGEVQRMSADRREAQRGQCVGRRAGAHPADLEPAGHWR